MRPGKDQWLKIASAVLALVLWFFVNSRGHAGANIEVPVTFVNVPAGLTVLNAERHGVTLDIRGHDRFLRGLDTADVKVRVSLERARPGQTSVAVTRDEIDLPAPLRVVSITPSNLSVFVEEVMQKRLPVRATVVGLPARGYVTRAVEVSPDEVVVTGPRSEVREMRYVETEPVTIDDLGASLTVRTPVIGLSRSLAFSHELVDVQITIEKSE
jgi:YbbR domain-containing protein